MMITPELAAEFTQCAAELRRRLQAIQDDTLTFALDVEKVSEKCLREMPPSADRDAFIRSLNSLKAALVAATAVSVDTTD